MGLFTTNLVQELESKVESLEAKNARLIELINNPPKHMGQCEFIRAEDPYHPCGCGAFDAIPPSDWLERRLAEERAKVWRQAAEGMRIQAKSKSCDKPLTFMAIAGIFDEKAESEIRVGGLGGGCGDDSGG